MGFLFETSNGRPKEQQTVQVQEVPDTVVLVEYRVGYMTQKTKNHNPRIHFHSVPTLPTGEGQNQAEQGSYISNSALARFGHPLLGYSGYAMKIDSWGVVFCFYVSCDPHVIPTVCTTNLWVGCSKPAMVYQNNNRQYR